MKDLEQDVSRILEQDVSRILEEAPAARQALLDNYSNLCNVADYCISNYSQSGESDRALEETKSLAAQSLASVAYQVVALASSVLRLLDAQSEQLRHIESSIHLIGQGVAMHRERVARREVGAFAVGKRIQRSTRLPAPTNQEPRGQYRRCPINYCVLDTLGHGIKEKLSDRSGSLRKHGSSIRSIKPPEPVPCPAPPTFSTTNSSFGKHVAPPTVPSWRESQHSDVITLLDEALPPLSVAEDADLTRDAAPPPPPSPPAVSDLAMQLVTPPTSLEIQSNHSVPPEAPPPPSLCLETVVEEPSAPPPPPAQDDVIIPSANEDLPLPAPPPPPSPLGQEMEALHQSRRSRFRRLPPSTRSLSVRVRSGPASRHRYAHSLFLPTVQSLMIPPPPPYPPPCAPLSSHHISLPASLQHLDLEILPAPPPLPPLDAELQDDVVTVPLPPPVDHDISGLETVVALYSYEASKPEDLSFTEGDVIYLTRQHDDGWWEGIVNGNRGFFPQNYVQSVD